MFATVVSLVSMAVSLLVAALHAFHKDAAANKIQAVEDAVSPVLTAAVGAVKSPPPKKA